MTANKSCQICCAAQHKYKCPKCYLKYCSVDCYKKHTELPCKSLRKDDEPIQERILADSGITFAIDSTKSTTLPYDTGVTKSTVLPEKLQLLRRDEKVLGCLQNPHLRNLLVNLNGAPDPATTLHAAMLEPLFVDLADHCLRVVDGEAKNTQ